MLHNLSSTKEERKEVETAVTAMLADALARHIADQVIASMKRAS